MAYKFLRSMQQDSHLRKILVLFLSGDVEVHRVQEAIGVGGNRLWVKPFTPALLEKKQSNVCPSERATAHSILHLHLDSIQPGMGHVQSILLSTLLVSDRRPPTIHCHDDRCNAIVDHCGM